MAAGVTRREAVVAVVRMTATMMMTGRAAFIPVQAGAVAALARGDASTVAFMATSPGSAPKPRKEEALFIGGDDEPTLL